ncbi:nuclear transport factor 2 family protein [Rhodohalobacter sulfatireducens]|uniref:Nuclear transport factor 2 family protein n=1 Tax=Rhodohalobacter sulfatireducens TaxID=2911366 RepID=A0ABS9KID0_9BACT|nr:nuclear transport factor 2 family protein [Rhodohalobacter sulfatireducens]MCG2590614.1 nuclear transport factor 2 family protein [Rhodohalobacter sulfatireducens]MDR9366349.1 nuclear transport factor 2 family protein [Balneolaceae bacterium]MDR9408704.1 nuclear transport factor 2 family protein [Balneolaceae bacterium]
MKKLISIILLQLLFMPALFAQESDEVRDLEQLLDEFLRGASENDAEIHDRFWAEDLIYTSSNGERVTKEIIMEGLADNPQNMNQQTPDYHAEETQIQLFDDIAVVTFKLVAISQPPSGEERLEFYNTGTFQKRDGQWKAVAWQATRIPMEM